VPSTSEHFVAKSLVGWLPWLGGIRRIKIVRASAVDAAGTFDLCHVGIRRIKSAE